MPRDFCWEERQGRTGLAKEEAPEAPEKDSKLLLRSAARRAEYSPFVHTFTTERAAYLQSSDRSRSGRRGSGLRLLSYDYWLSKSTQTHYQSYYCDYSAAELQS
jgi:hypothetical protein